MSERSEVKFGTNTFLTSMGKGRAIAKYASNMVLVSQGQFIDAVYYIIHGEVDLTVASNRGTKIAVAVLGPNDFLGQGCIAGQQQYLVTAKTMSDCEIMRLEKSELMRVIHEEPTFSEMFALYLFKMRPWAALATGVT